MVRTYKKKSERQVHTPRKLKKALELVLKGYSIRVASKECGVNRDTVWQLKKKANDATSIKEVDESIFNLSHKSRSIFTPLQEEAVVDFCKNMAAMGFGLTVEKVREVAWETALKNDLNVPEKWRKNMKAGMDWFQGFMRRHTDLSIRSPEACSIARASAFNKHTVQGFYTKLKEVLGRHHSFQNGSRVYNLDETSTCTVQNTRRVVSPKGVQQIHQVKSAERGTSVTTCCFVGAHGIVLPPVLIFPRINFVSTMLFNCFPGTLGLANKKGYMTKELFVPVMKHFIKCTNSSLENPTLLLVDSVGSHLSGEVLELCKQSGVTLFTFPPHCTHKLQPLDVSLFGPFKVYYDSAVSSWMLNNPGQPVTIYHIASFVREALGRAATPSNIISGFEKAGIYPFNENIFQDSDFIMSVPTEQPNPQDMQADIELAVNPTDTPSPSTSSEIEDNTTAAAVSKDKDSFISPSQFRGYPKATPCVPKRKPRRKGKCMTATDTPEKEEIIQREREALEKKKQIEERKKAREEKKRAREKKQNGRKVKNKQKKGKTTRRVLTYADSSDENSAGEASDCSNDIDEPEEVCVPVQPPLSKGVKHFPTLKNSPSEGDYVLVLFNDAKDPKYFVGKIIKEVDEEGDLEISYLRKTEKVNHRFVLPDVPDLNSVNIADIKAILPMPTNAASHTKRQQSFMIFKFDFSDIKLG